MPEGIYNLDWTGWCLALFCCLVVGMSKCGITGLATMAVPLMAMVVPAKASTGVMLPILIVGDALGVAYFQRHANWKLLVKLMPAALVGIVVGFFLLGQPWLDNNVIKKSIGVLVTLLVLLNICRAKFNISFGEKSSNSAVTIVVACIFGILAGITTMIANAAGPIIVIYLIAMKLPKEEFIGTSAWYFLLLNWIKVPFMIERGLINQESIMFNLKIAPAVFVGAILGILLTKHLSEKNYKIWIQILTVIAALKLLF